MKISTMVKVAGLALVVVLCTAAPALAQEKSGTTSYSFTGSGLGAGLGMALSIIGAGYGLGKIGSAALDGMARQPEVAPRIQTAMIIIAAMLEGATLASVILCFLVGNKATF
jgi:F-type H+-transporting ATPase subunit c